MINSANFQSNVGQLVIVGSPGETPVWSSGKIERAHGVPDDVRIDSEGTYVITSTDGRGSETLRGAMTAHRVESPRLFVVSEEDLLETGNSDDDLKLRLANTPTYDGRAKDIDAIIDAMPTIRQHYAGK